MINPLNKTEYSFRYAYGKIKDIVERSSNNAIVMADRYTTFGHIPFYKLCKKADKKPILGVELAFVDDALLKNRQNANLVTLLARNKSGLRKIYELVSKSTKQKYYYNRLDKEELRAIPEKDVVIIFKEYNISEYLIGRQQTYFAITAVTNYNDIIYSKFPLVAASDNIYDVPENEPLYQIIMGNGQWEGRTHAGHVLEEEEWRQSCNFLPDDMIMEAIDNTFKIELSIENFDLPQAQLPKNEEKRTLLEICQAGARERGCDLTDPVYKARLERELKLIKEKEYEEYFYLTWDLVVWAKQHMFVGPARGSSAGSLVCYLLFITDVDPIPFNLIFERFIDVNRFDMPDVDIDFQDTKREMVIDYLKNKYGHDCVAKLGTISKYKPKSILTEIAKILSIPVWEITDLKKAIPERKSGDDRATDCLADSFTDMEIGKKFLEEHPNLWYSQFIEGHNRHFGQHAAGIIVSEFPVNNYGSVENSSDGIMLNKEDAEEVNLLKMDCLGLRTLSVIQDCLDLIKKDRDWIVNYPLDDKKAFDVINERRFGGIFQFEGPALISIAKQIIIKNINDIAAINALGRPGPLGSGGTERYIVHKNNPDQVEYLPFCKEYTEETYGIIVYQEQVMFIVKNIGDLSWKDTISVRKIMGKTLGDEALSKYKEKFIKGSNSKHNLSEKNALKIWEDIKKMGSYAFNKSHAVSYGLISYWCMVLKAHHPLEFALATLKNAKDEEQVINILKELVKEGYEYKTFDKELSQTDWSIQEGKLIGGFINIKGIGKQKAKTFIKKRKNNIELTAAENRMLFNAITPYDNVFEFKDKFTPFYENWEMFFKDKPALIEDIEFHQDCRFICKIFDHSIRDLNEEILIKKRDGKVITDGPIAFLDVKMSDDSDFVQGRIAADKFEQFGRKIAEDDKKGSFYLVHGYCCKTFKYIMIKNIKQITPEEVLEKINKMEER